MSKSDSIQWAASILDVEPDAEADTVKRAFRQKAKECHPDVNTDSDAEVQFQRVMQARIILIEGPEQAGHEVTEHGFGHSTPDGESKQTGYSETATDGTAASGSSTETDRYATHVTNPDDGSPFTEGVSDSDVWEEWRREREQNERTGRSRYTRDTRQQHWKQARAEDRRPPTASSSRSSNRDRRKTNRRSRRSSNSVIHDQRWGQRLQIAFRYLARFALLLGIFAALIPLGISGGTPLVSLTSRLGFILVVGGISGGIAAHQILSTATRERQNPTSATTSNVQLGVIAGSNILGLGLAALAYTNGYSLGGFRFIATTFVPALVFGFLGALFGIIVSLIGHSSSDLSQGFVMNRSAFFSGIIGGFVGLFGILARINSIPFLRNAGPGTFTASPWIPAFSIASVKLSVPLNFLVGATMTVTLLGSVTAALWIVLHARDTSGHPRDRLTHHPLKHGIWTLLVAIPPAVLLWLYLTGQRALELSFGTLPRQFLTGLVLLYPTLIIGGRLLSKLKTERSY